MAIQPIDLQTLFTQMDKVGKDQSNQKEGLQVRQDVHNIHQQQKQEQRIQSVNEAQDTGQGAERIKDRNRKNNSGQDESSEKERENPEDEIEESKINFVKDPALGQNIDVSG
jgi:hypothetical protein